VNGGRRSGSGLALFSGDGLVVRDRQIVHGSKIAFLRRDQDGKAQLLNARLRRHGKPWRFDQKGWARRTAGTLPSGEYPPPRGRLGPCPTAVNSPGEYWLAGVRAAT
jgi:hypothetical protein